MAMYDLGYGESLEDWGDRDNLGLGQMEEKYDEKLKGLDFMRFPGKTLGGLQEKMRSLVGVPAGSKEVGWPISASPLASVRGVPIGLALGKGRFAAWLQSLMKNGYPTGPQVSQHEIPQSLAERLYLHSKYPNLIRAPAQLVDELRLQATQSGLGDKLGTYANISAKQRAADTQYLKQLLLKAQQFSSNQ